MQSLDLVDTVTGAAFCLLLLPAANSAGGQPKGRSRESLGLVRQTLPRLKGLISCPENHGLCGRRLMDGWTSSWSGGSHWQRVGLESSSSDLESSQWSQAHPPTYHMLVLWSSLHVTCENEWLVPGHKGYFVLQNVKFMISEREIKSDSEKIVLVLCPTMNEWPSSCKREVEQELPANLKRNPHVDCYTVVLIRWALHGWQLGQPSIPSLQVFAHKADLCFADVRWQGCWWVISVLARVYSLRTSVTRSYSGSSID